jgi:predicted DCC family thiol-disulfide oxidoreductase YuxK
MSGVAPLLPSADAAHPAQTPVLLYDGECGVCAESVQFVLAHERSSAETVRPLLRFAPLQGTFAQRIHAAVPALAGIDAVVWVLPQPAGPAHVLVKSDAVLAVLRYLGGAWRLLGQLGGVLPRAWRDALYDAVARRRRGLRAQRCLLPFVVGPSRFLE